MLFVLAVLAATASGCGGDEDSPCVSAGKTICAEACSCGGSTGCAIGDASGAITFDSEADCVALYTFGCSQPQGGTDHAACESALANPVCVQSTDGQALDLPAACE